MSTLGLLDIVAKVRISE